MYYIGKQLSEHGIKGRLFAILLLTLVEDDAQYVVVRLKHIIFALVDEIIESWGLRATDHCIRDLVVDV